jgi:hypothetical protein
VTGWRNSPPYSAAAAIASSDPRVLVVQADSKALNPSLRQATIDRDQQFGVAVGGIGMTTIREPELTGMATEYAKHEYPGLSDEQAFTRLYASPNGELLRRALAVAKAMPSPPVVGGDDVDVNDPAKALAQLQELIAELRRHARDLTESEAWNRVVRDHPVLAKRAIAA